jgi:hypothetical protein
MVSEQGKDFAEVQAQIAADRDAEKAAGNYVAIDAGNNL